ncbi:H2 finger protein [Seminavis robusta]|uniref:H2 finger protein n=1 Tax=Seminavis robusta TaxID=568900 RepID=A0A9N8E815_9STRA|nr:H2 finger protein [Seminavis robusta]|eukprot:Sro596_g172770.1 H2 finger protein (279) ;mRNA; r:16353-17189
MMVHRHLQHAKLGLVKSDEEEGSVKDPSLLFPYVVSIIVCVSLAVYALHYLHSYICRNIFGREPPFDPIEGEQVLANLTEDQRKAVTHALLSKYCKSAANFEQDSGKSKGNNAGTVKETSKEEATAASVERRSDSDPTRDAASASIQARQDQETNNGNESHDVEQGTKILTNDAPQKEEEGMGEKDQTSQSDTNNDDRECPICLGNFLEGDVLVESNKCRHVCHVNCISEWLSNGHDNCPVCRVQMITKEDLMRAAWTLVKKPTNGNDDREKSAEHHA